MSDKKTKENDLDDLLDSALADFDIPAEQADGQSSDKKNDDGSADVTELWNDDFFAEQTKLLGERMNGIFGPSGSEPVSQDHMNLGFQKLAEAAAIAMQGGSGAAADTPSSDANYADCITEALKGLQDGIDNLQAPVSETDVASMFSGLGIGGSADTDANPFLPFMQGMMQTLLSADILLPSIKELIEKYPKYLEENSEKLNPEDKERYEKQLELFQMLGNDLESEKPDDNAAVKQERFKRVLDNMQKLHDYGQPPDELTDGVGGAGFPGLEAITGGGGLGSNNQCPTM